MPYTGISPPRGSRRAAPITMSCGWTGVSLSSVSGRCKQGINLLTDKFYRSVISDIIAHFLKCSPIQIKYLCYVFSCQGSMVKTVAGATAFSVSVSPDTNTPDRNLRFAETFLKFFKKL